MAKFIIDTDALSSKVKELVSVSPEQYRTNGNAEVYIRQSLRNAHNGKELEPWLTPYKDKKSRVAAGTGPYSKLFEAFWAKYPARNGQKQGKRPAFKVWCKLLKSFETKRDISVELQFYEVCLRALKWQVLTDEWRKDNGMFIPMASTYLNQERWTDERPEGTPAGKKMVRNSEGLMVEVDI